MSAEWKPEGHSTVSPYLLVDDAARVIEFLRAVFGAEPVRRFDDDNGRIVHAEVRIDDTIVMLADSAEQWPSFPSMVHVYVRDVDAVHRRAIDQGATVVQEPSVKQGDEDRRGGFMDPGGNTWWVATRQQGLPA